MHPETKQPITLEMLTQKLLKTYSFGFSDIVILFFAVLLIAIGIATLAAIIGLVFLAGGIYMLWSVIDSMRKWKRRKANILQQRFWLSAMPICKKKIQEGDGDTVDLYCVYVDEKQRYFVEKPEYDETQEWDLIYLLHLEGEQTTLGHYLQRYYTPDEQVLQHIR